MSIKQEVSLPFKFSYSGEGHFIDINTLIATQSHFLTAINEINKHCNSSFELSLKVEAIEKGSFELNELIVVGTTSGLLTAPAINCVESIFSVLESYINIKSFLKDKPAEKAEHISENIDASINNNNSPTVNIFLLGDNIKVDKDAFHLYMNNSVLSNAVNKIGEALVLDKDIEGIKLKNTDNNASLLDIQKERFEDLITPNAYTDSETKEEEFDSVTMTITKPELNLTKNSKWNFIYKGRKLNSVLMKDKDFLSKVADGIYAFRNGDALEVNLTIGYKMDKSFKTFVENKFEITKVIRPIFIERQSGLF